MKIISNSGFLAAVSTVVLMASCSKQIESTPVADQELTGQSALTMEKPFVIEATMVIDSAVKQFKDVLGPLSLNQLQPDGRREVKWDDVALFLANKNFPGTYYNRTDEFAPYDRKRGVVFSTPGSSLVASHNNFIYLDSSYADELVPFSPTKSLGILGSNIVDIDFKVPGTEITGYVHGFGAVFSDVDKGSSTEVLFYSGDILVDRFKVKNSNMDKFTFLGVNYPETKITRVRILLGEAGLGDGNRDVSDTMGKDLVVLDDIMFNNPKQF